MHNIFLAQVLSDRTEGRGPLVTIAAFTHHADAASAVVGLGGGGYGDGEVTTLTVYDNLDEYKQHNLHVSPRDAALAKLTPQERLLLGLK